MDLKDIKAIIDLMKKNSLSEFELERQDFKIKLKRSGGGNAVTYDEGPPVYTLAPPAAVAVPSSATPSAVSAGNNASAGLSDIKSPMIGTFYRAPSPESANYIEIGAEVHPETVVCIIEAMKVMNEIKAEMRGVIVETPVDNAKPVEFGQPLFRIRPL
ncbi:MAG: acetyl-CoA carboxylase [Verrucomicrobiales bacterium]|nr:acetyl-CoA carboxylase [Verrucomicrobiales bacterium]